MYNAFYREAFNQVDLIEDPLITDKFDLIIHMHYSDMSFIDLIHRKLLSKHWSLKYLQYLPLALLAFYVLFKLIILFY